MVTHNHGTAVELPYGDSLLRIDVDSSGEVRTLLPPRVADSGLDEEELVRQALANPIGTARLRDIVKPGERIALIVPDLSRPCPVPLLLRLLLEELNRAGVQDSDCFVVVGIGLHKPLTESELVSRVGESVSGRLRTLNHNPDDTVMVATTPAGTPVEVSRPVAQADRRICLGTIDFHYFAGYSGGVKAIIPGCASERSIRANHAMMFEPRAGAGRMESNPVRMDLEQAAALVGVDFMLNVVLDERQVVSAAYSGHVVSAHRRGCEAVARRGRVVVPRQADLILVSPGGRPRDCSLFQAQKALDNARYVVRPGGIIILFAECPNGFGQDVFEKWMREPCTPDDLLLRIRQDFVIGGHKAAAIAAILRKAQVLLVSSLAERTSLLGCLRSFQDPQHAVRVALEVLGRAIDVLALPQGLSTLAIPKTTEQGGTPLH